MRLIPRIRSRLGRLRDELLPGLLSARVERSERSAPGVTQRLPILPVSDDPLADRLSLLRYAQQGPYLRTAHKGRLTTYIFSLDAGRRLLRQHDGDLRTITFDGTHLFPHGVLRQMDGDAHRQYRRVFTDAFRTITIAANGDAIATICDGTTRRLVDAGDVGIAELRRHLHETATAVLIRMCLGLDQGDRRYEAVATLYRDITTDRLVRTFNRRRFAQVREVILGLARDGTGGVVGYLKGQGETDATIVGNIALMIEVGRYDLFGLWVWLIKILADNPDILPQVASLRGRDTNAVSEMVVLEALRLERIEYLDRAVKSDIVFDGLLYPKHSHIKIAVWAAHKDPQHFPDPFRFDPDRFMAGQPSLDRYAPLGMDRHRCLGAEWVVGASAALVRSLARNCHPTVLSDGEVERDKYHFAPSSRLVIRFNPKDGPGQIAPGSVS